MVAAAADLTLFVDEHGVIREVALGDGVEPHAGWEKLVGRAWRDTVTVECQNKVDLVLREARELDASKAREINQTAEGVGEVPFRVKALVLDDGRVAVLGRDLRPLARLQQGLVTSQQAMDREYTRLRQADTRYRVLFHVSSEGVVVADGETRKIVEANPAAGSMVGDSAQSLTGKVVEDLFEPKSRETIRSLVLGVNAGSRPIEVSARLLGQPDREITVTASLFRQASATVLIVRFWAASAMNATARATKMLAVLEAMPDGFVVTSADRRILTVNTAFCQLLDTSESQVVGESLERWVGRPGVDLNIMLAALREHGTLTNFATVIHNDFGQQQEAVVTAVSALDGKVPCFGFTIRPVSSRIPAPTSSVLPRSVDQLRELVGRVPLKELVRESADLVERLCIEAALHVSNNNRASAAQLLGLSRQGFYSKMKRYGLEAFGSDD